MSKYKIGDVFSIETPKGKCYFQMVLEKPQEGSLIRILQGLHNEDVKNIQDLVNDKELFIIYFPLKYALKKKIVIRVDSYTIPDFFSLPKKMRSPVVDNKGNLKYWHIIDLKTFKRKTVKKLSNSQKKLSPYGIWNDSLLVERLVSGWTLDNWKEI